MSKAAFHTLGCKVNSYETEAMQQLLEDAGYEIVPFKDGADIYIINTCSVTNMADRKSRQMLHRAKKMNGEAVVVAVGCYVQAAKKELEADSTIDLIIGNNRKQDIVQILEEYFRDKNEREAVIDIGAAGEYENLKIRKISDHTRAFIKVQDGCSQFCSYCIIPYTRGRIRSRKPDDILEEIERLSEAGYQEIVLTGIHLSSYGLDFPEDEKETLLSLIKRLGRLEKIKRIRLGSLEPRIITREFARALAENKKICPHFHLSLQSGCEETLKRMNRRYTPGEYLEGCRILREEFVDPAVTTDVIVGFPGETEEEFETTKAFLKQVHFYEMHVFKYSKREGTRAALMPDQVTEQKKAERSNDLLRLELAMSKEFRNLYLGKEAEVLLEEPLTIDGTDYMVGHTKEYIKAVVPFRADCKNVFVKGILKSFLTDEILYLEET